MSPEKNKIKKTCSPQKKGPLQKKCFSSSNHWKSQGLCEFFGGISLGKYVVQEHMFQRGCLEALHRLNIGSSMRDVAVSSLSYLQVMTSLCQYFWVCWYLIRSMYSIVNCAWMCQTLRKCREMYHESYEYEDVLNRFFNETRVAINCSRSCWHQKWPFSDPSLTLQSHHPSTTPWHGWIRWTHICLPKENVPVWWWSLKKSIFTLVKFFCSPQIFAFWWRQFLSFQPEELVLNAGKWWYCWWKKSCTSWYG